MFDFRENRCVRLSLNVQFKVFVLKQNHLRTVCLIHKNKSDFSLVTRSYYPSLNPEAFSLSVVLFHLTCTSG